MGKGIVAASSRCCILKTEGPAVVSLEKDYRIANILKSGPIVVRRGWCQWRYRRIWIIIAYMRHLDWKLVQMTEVDG